MTSSAGGAMDLGFLVLRLVVGLTFVAHGTQKLFGWFGGYGLAGTGAFLEQLGFRPGKRAALFAGLSEAAGGLLLALGAATPVAAALLIGVMLVAVVSVHLQKGFFVSAGGYEYNLVLATVAFAFSSAGPGRDSLDAFFGQVHAGLVYGLGSLLVGSLGAGLELALRHRAPTIQVNAKAAS